MQVRQSLSSYSTSSVFYRVRHASYSATAWRRVPLAAKTVTGDLTKSFDSLVVQQPRSSFDTPHSSKPDPSSLSSVKLSLFAQLFPEEVNKKADPRPQGEDADLTVPPLPLPTVDDLPEVFERPRSGGLCEPKDATQAAFSDAYRHRKTAILVLQCASKSLVENDFRRIAPKSMHIEGWSGPGDVLSVFPARDPITFEQSDHYFIIFANPAYARIYQSHVHRLYRLVRQQTPTSIESPLPHQRGVKVNGEDANAMLQNFALCPPSHRLKLLYNFDTLPPNMSRLLDQGGYFRDTDGTDRAARAVLFWADGFSPTSQEINTIIASDGRDRGMAWDVSISKLDVPAEGLDSSSEDLKQECVAESSDDKAPLRSSQRWILTFKSESEARRFIRAWHRKTLASKIQKDPYRVSAELLW